MTQRLYGEGPNPSGLCQCGCGQAAPIATRNHGRHGHIKGLPTRFLRGHSGAKSRHETALAQPSANPSGLCQCGCGQPVPKATWSQPGVGVRRGQFTRYIPGHQSWKTTPLYEVDQATGCWVWTGAKHPEGYPEVRVEGKIVRAHRHYYELHKGPLGDGLVVHHTCGNRGCVNPDHLELLTPSAHTRLHAAHR